MKKETTGKIVRQYCKDYPNTNPTELSKKIFSEHKAQFDSVEQIRYLVRTKRGIAGKHNREVVSDKSLFGTGTLQLPKSISEDYKPLILDLKDNNIGVISDLHIPNHREKPIEVALNYFKEQKINTLLINGDLLDNTPFSKWEHKPIAPDDVRKWFNTAEEFLALLRKGFPKARIIWLEGNHDFWYYRFLMKKAEVLFGDPYFHLKERLHLDKYKIEYLPQERYLMAGKLAIAHGHHLIKGIIAPVNAARGLFLRAKVNALIGHVHVESSHTDPNLHGDMIACWSTGCLCSLTPDYQPMGGKACHGATHIKVGKGGDFNVHNFRIYRGKIL